MLSILLISCWGEPEQAQHRHVECELCLSVCMYVCMRMSYREYTLLQITEPERLHVSRESQGFNEHGGVVFSKYFSNNSANKACRRTDTTHGPTYSLARVIRATIYGKKVSSVDATVCVVASRTHKFGLCVLKLLVTLTYQWLYIAVHVKSDGKSASSVHTP